MRIKRIALKVLVLTAVSAVFPRADAKASIEQMMELEKLEVARQLELLGKKPEPAAVAQPWGLQKLALTGMVTFLVMLAIFLFFFKVSKL